uniref:Putative secreted protein n=1 Tax=Ixodes ricinus TaxID=34613 RepID=A0A147BAF4_IXORI
MGETFVALLLLLLELLELPGSTWIHETCSNEQNGSSPCLGSTGFSSRSRSRLCINHFPEGSYELSSKQTEGA